jgi:16S rRNA (cytidine1402-2'-O)-methyltransferase
MVQVLGDRPAVVTRELTKFHEEVRRGTLGELKMQYQRGEPPKGEITVLVAPPGRTVVDTARSDALLAKALAFMPVRAAADLVAEALDGPRHALYERALEMRRHER